MKFYFREENLVGDAEEVPDKLRGELGKYWSVSPSTSQFVLSSYESGKIVSSDVSNSERNDMVMFPRDSHIINIYGLETAFRDMLQWNMFVKDTCKVDVRYSDHYFMLFNYDVNAGILTGSHNPSYEDATKVYDTNLLLNYNLADYKYNEEDEKIKLFSSLRSEVDPEELKKAPTGNSDVARILEQYRDRIETYDGSLSNLDREQRFVFKLTKKRHGINAAQWPCYFTAEINPEAQYSKELLNAMRETNNTKYFMQSIKNNLTLIISSF